MFCKYCGSELSDGARFCTSCGNRVDNENVQENNGACFASDAQDNVVYASEDELSQSSGDAFVPESYDTVTQACDGQNYAYAENGGCYEDAEVVKKKKGLKILVSAIAVILVLAIGFFAFAGPYATNAVNKLFRSPAGYLTYVVENNIDDVSDGISGFIGLFKNMGQIPENISANMEVEAGEGLKKLISDSVGDYAILVDWIDKLGLDMDMTMNESALAIDADVSVNGEKIVNIGEYSDVDNNEMYVWSSELFPKAVKLSAEESGLDFSDYAYSYTAMKEALGSISKILPDEDKVEDIIKRYTLAAVNNIEKVEKESVAVSAGEISEKCTILTATVDSGAALAIARAVLVEAKNDSNIRAIIKDVCEAYGEDYEEAIASFNESIEEGLASLNEMTPEDMGEGSVDILFWVDNTGDIIGIGADIEGAVIEFISLEDGPKTGSEIKIEASGVNITVNGEGEKKGDILNAIYSVELNSLKLLNVEVENLDTEKLGDGVFSGKCVLALGKDVDKALSMISGEDVPVDDLSTIKISVSGDAKSKTKSKAKIDVEYQGKMFASIACESEVSDSAKVRKPADYADSSEAESVLANFDISKITGNLEKAGAPAEFLQYLADAVSGSVQEEPTEEIDDGFVDEYGFYDDEFGDYYIE